MVKLGVGTIVQDFNLIQAWFSRCIGIVSMWQIHSNLAPKNGPFMCLRYFLVKSFLFEAKLNTLKYCTRNFLYDTRLISFQLHFILSFML